MNVRSLLRSIFPKSKPIVQTFNKPVEDVVVILGWAGSNPKNYVKLQQYYHSIGKTTILEITPLFTPNFIRKEQTESLVSIINYHCLSSKNENKSINNDNKSKKLYFHIFSNNGSWTYSSLYFRSKLQHPEKVIIDSAPFFYYNEFEPYDLAVLFSKAITSIVLREPIYYHSIITPIVIYMLTAFFYMDYNIIKKINSDYQLLPEYVKLNDFFRNDSPNIPTLFIYSLGDKIIPKENILEFKKYLDNRNIITSEKFFGEEVKHVAAYFKYPKEYEDVVKEFFFSDDKKL